MQCEASERVWNMIEGAMQSDHVSLATVTVIARPVPSEQQAGRHGLTRAQGPSPSELVGSLGPLCAAQRNLACPALFQTPGSAAPSRVTERERGS